MVYEKIEKAGQFTGCGLTRIRLRRSGQKVQTFIGCGHVPVQQGSVHAIEIPKRLEHAESRPQVEMKSGMTDAREVDQNYIAVAVLQGERGVDRCGRASHATVGAEEPQESRRLAGEIQQKHVRRKHSLLFFYVRGF
jgi:hypothetical protein